MARNLVQEVANRLVMIRAELRLTQTQMAQYLEIDRGRYWHWEGFATNRPTIRRRLVKAKPQKHQRDQGNLPAIDVMIRLAERSSVTLDYIYRGEHGGLQLAMSIRLAAREQGLDPDAPQFQTPAGKKALRAKTGV
jgi:hypothetical protein